MLSDGVTSGGRRKPSWRERENNRRRERRRRAVAAKIYAGLRAQGNYNLPKHCDNNEVLKALCRQAGWIVHDDGTTYRKGCRPPPLDIVGTSNRVTPYTSQNASPLSSTFHSPFASYQVSPASSSFPSPSRDDGNNQTNNVPFFFNGIASLPSLRISNSAPVTPPISSPTSRTPQPIPNWESIARETMVSFNYAASAPTSPTHRQFRAPVPIPECDESDGSTVESAQWINFQRVVPKTVPTLPAFNLVQPAVERLSLTDEVNGRGPGFNEFGDGKLMAWEGEMIHEVAMDDLELTLGTGNSRN